MEQNLEDGLAAVDDLLQAIRPDIMVPGLSPGNLISRNLKSRERTPDAMAAYAIAAAEAFTRCHTCPPAYGREDMSKALPKLSDKYSATRHIDFRTAQTLDPKALTSLVEQRIQVRSFPRPVPQRRCPYSIALPT